MCRDANLNNYYVNLNNWIPITLMTNQYFSLYIKHEPSIITAGFKINVPHISIPPLFFM